jgi:hypothetical protein
LVNESHTHYTKATHLGFTFSNQRP